MNEKYIELPNKKHNTHFYAFDTPILNSVVKDRRYFNEAYNQTESYTDCRISILIIFEVIVGSSYICQKLFATCNIIVIRESFQQKR